jgi:4-nitrophenyl phosphatase
MTKIKAMLLDMDGVLWRDTEAIGDLPANLRAIEAKGVQAAFVTNNATRTVAMYQEKFAGFGAQVAAEQIFTSSNATALYLSEQHKSGNVYVIGERGLRQALEERGFKIAEEDVVAVVVGLDRELTYEKLRRATLLIRNGAAFIGTNPDRTLPSPDGPVPGAGSILASLEASTDTKPVVIGKPGTAILEAAMTHLGVTPAETLMVGDRIDTDVAAGQKAGCRSALVLTGITSEQEARAWRPAPDFIEKDLATLISKL